MYCVVDNAGCVADNHADVDMIGAGDDIMMMMMILMMFMLMMRMISRWCAF